jgi:hypothetical protein
VRFIVVSILSVVIVQTIDLKEAHHNDADGAANHQTDQEK